jgi:hypothetical protein
VKKISNETTDTNSVRLRLVNKKTGKLASSTNWLVDLAAEAKVLGDSSGISALLPQKKAAKLLVRNELKPLKTHQEKSVAPGYETSHKDLRILAKSAYCEVFHIYAEEVVLDRTAVEVNSKGFRAWLIQELSNPKGKLNRHLKSSKEFHPLIELDRSDDWWRKCLKTESKSKAKS